MHQSVRKGTSLLAAVAVSFLPAASAYADEGNGPNGKPGRVASVSSANPKAAGVSAPNVLSPELIAAIVAQGSNQLENPSDLSSFYGYDNGGPLVPVPGDLLGAKIPTPFRGGWRLFFNQQHGDNNTWEILRKDKSRDDDRD